MRGTAQIIRLLEEVEREQREIDAKQSKLSERRERLMKELFESMDEEKYDFDDERLIVRWSGGTLPFRKYAHRAYVVLKLLLQNPDEWIPFADIAEVAFGDPLRNVYHIIYNINLKLLKYGFPATIDMQGQQATITRT